MDADASSQRMPDKSPIPMILRILWFIFIGWHVTLDWIVIAWLLNVSVIGLPLGLWMLNRVPQVLTLKPPRWYTVSDIEDGKVVRIRHQGEEQRSWLVRLPYFLLIGWWFSLLWSIIAWALSASIVGLPVGILMLNGLPAVTTLHRG